jgi:hypothetical protein
MLEEFLNKPGVFSMSAEALNELKRQFLGTSKEHDLVEAGEMFMKLVSHMGQGLLHYSSSVYHCCLHLYMKTYQEMYFNHYKEKGLLPKEAELIISIKVSSDDWSMIRTIVYPKSEVKMLRQMMRFLNLCSVFSVIGCEHVNIKTSLEKSTWGTFSNVEEFNSIWFVSNCLMLPLMKMLYAAMKNPFSDDFQKRIITGMESLKKMSESGSPTWLNCLIQQCHARIHYTNFGARIDQIFDFFAEKLLSKLHPAFGFYLFEPECVSGIMGYEYAMFRAIRENNTLRKLEKSIYSKKEVSVSELGKPTLRVTLLLGDAKSFLSAVDRMKIPTDWREKLLKKPIVLLEGSKNIEDSKNLIYQKIYSPGAIEAYSYRVDSKMVASALYVLWAPCVTVGEVLTDEKIDPILVKKELEKKPRKFSYTGKDSILT